MLNQYIARCCKPVLLLTEHSFHLLPGGCTGHCSFLCHAHSSSSGCKGMYTVSGCHNMLFSCTAQVLLPPLRLDEKRHAAPGGASDDHIATCLALLAVRSMLYWPCMRVPQELWLVMRACNRLHLHLHSVLMSTLCPDILSALPIHPSYRTDGCHAAVRSARTLGQSMHGGGC